MEIFLVRLSMEMHFGKCTLCSASASIHGGAELLKSSPRSEEVCDDFEAALVKRLLNAERSVGRVCNVDDDECLGDDDMMLKLLSFTLYTTAAVIFLGCFCFA